MIWEITYPARCKDCIYCGYYHITKKDGTKSYVRRHTCYLTGNDARLKDKVCERWKMNASGTPHYFDRIREILEIKKDIL